jgi:cytochrome c2
LQATDGKTIFTACNKCHLIIAQGQEVNVVRVDLTQGLPFQHPGEDGERLEEFTECTDCHSGGAAVYD